MAAVASAPQSAIGATPPSAPSSNPTNTQPPPRLLLRLPPQPEIDGRRNPLKRKWRSIVNFFALPIRAYYLEPPGAAYRAELRARRGNPWEDGDAQLSFWPVPAYTDEVGDDEMVLFKAQEEAEALAAMQRDQAAAEAERGEQVQEEGSPDFNDAFSDDDEEEEQERLASASVWPQTPPEASSMRAFQGQLVAEPSPRYERTDPLSSALPLSIPNGRAYTRPRTSSNLTPITAEPTFANGITMSRHLSTPLSPTPSSPPSSSGIFARRNRALTTTARPNLGGRNISEPLSWTLVRSQYSYPKRGLTPEQLTFLSSVESLGRFGIPHSPSAAGVLPSPAYEVRVGQSDYGFPVTAAQDAHGSV
ncbi:uncharacterized protein UTRI_10493_B [Ustilago trichophora]|uniref:Uncharacterized protein n=1 Tax=Ustilago trichophora TaxID=86804 RepID=A0A5C3E8Z9_9BASI|nr:uncharacterized protein UTRI_10493_B [Ustilago trichophora]